MDINFEELERKIVERFSKNFPESPYKEHKDFMIAIAKTAARVATIAIQEYHELQKQK